VKRLLAVMGLLGAAAIGGSLAYQTAAREHEYRMFLERGNAAAVANDTFRAVEAYTAAIALHPDSMLAYLRRGETFQTRGDLDAAAGDFRRAATLDPSATRPIEALGDVQYERGWFGHAADAYQSRLGLDEAAPDVVYKLALARYRQGSLDQALAALERTGGLGDRSADALYLRGVCLREKGQLREAVEAFEAAAKLSPGLIPAREELADVYGALGRSAEQLDQLQVIAALDRENVDRQIAVGLAHARAARLARDPAVQQRHADLAVLTLGQSLERAPDQPLIYGALGQVWLDIAIARDDRVALSKSIEALERATSTALATSDVLNVYGQALLRDNRAEEAERVLQQATRRYPVHPPALLSYAGLAEEHQHHQAARAALFEYGAIVPDEPDFPARAATIARLSLRLNEPDTAAHWLVRASAASPDDIGLLAALADAQIRAGAADKARSTIARGLEQDPANAQLLALARRARL
jgi:tetratricopeptide (TPR) repeat protein